MSSSRALVADTIPFSCVDGPGNRFAVFLQGCNFDCLACHNPQTIPLWVPHARWATVDELVEEVRGAAPFIRGVTLSGGEATLQWPFVRDFFATVRADPDLARLTTLVDSNGACATSVWDAFAPVMSGAMIDLKCLDRARHVAMTGRPNDEVLASIRHLSAMDRLAEIRLLIVPGHNDDDVLMERTAAWIASVDSSARVKLIGFRRHGARAIAQAWPEATLDDLARSAAVLRSGGLTGVVH